MPRAGSLRAHTRPSGRRGARADPLELIGHVGGRALAGRDALRGRAARLALVKQRELSLVDRVGCSRPTPNRGDDAAHGRPGRLAAPRSALLGQQSRPRQPDPPYPRWSLPAISMARHRSVARYPAPRNLTAAGWHTMPCLDKGVSPGVQPRGHSERRSSGADGVPDPGIRRNRPDASSTAGQRPPVDDV